MKKNEAKGVSISSSLIENHNKQLYFNSTFGKAAHLILPCQFKSHTV
jgi:phosphoglycerate-specific signal transduction histidine kinase